MKKTQKQWIAVICLSVLIVVLAVGQSGGDQSSSPKLAPKSSGVVASARRVESIDEPVIARDAFWNPGLVERKEAPVTHSAPPKPLPQPSFEAPTNWIPPVRPDTSDLGLKKEAPSTQTEQKEAPPKKRLRVCGFMTTSQTPTIMLSLNGEDPKTCRITDRPWPNVTVLKVELDRATLKIENRKIEVTAGQEIEI